MLVWLENKENKDWDVVRHLVVNLWIIMLVRLNCVITLLVLLFQKHQQQIISKCKRWRQCLNFSRKQIRGCARGLNRGIVFLPHATLISSSAGLIDMGAFMWDIGTVVLCVVSCMS